MLSSSYAVLIPSIGYFQDTKVGSGQKVACGGFVMPRAYYLVACA